MFRKQMEASENSEGQIFASFVTVTRWTTPLDHVIHLALPKMDLIDRVNGEPTFG